MNVEVYPAKLLGSKLYALRKDGDSILLYRKVVDGILQAGLFYIEYDGEGNETAKPLRNNRWIYDGLGHRLAYVRERWEGNGE